MDRSHPREPRADPEQAGGVVRPGELVELGGDLIGVSMSSRLIFTVYALRELGNVIRIISARKATRNERKTYEEGDF